MADTYSCILFHIVFSTKHRRPEITPELEARLYDYMGGIIKNKGGILYEIGGMPDHVHILMRWNTGGIKDLLRDLKSDSTKWVRATYPEKSSFRWQAGGGIFSVSQSGIERLSAYIQKQEERHRVRTFKDEYIALLKKHGIEYDERYIFD